jgi:hypothetical protein
MHSKIGNLSRMTTLNYKKMEKNSVNFALTPVADEKAGIRIGLL